MNTEIFHIDKENPSPDLISKAGEILRNGGLVAFPTETVYGLGANALCPEAAANIFKAKGRPSDNPLIVHLASIDELSTIVREIPENAKKLFDTFSPGPLTVILKKRQEIDNIITAGLDTVAVRIPSHPIARELIKAAGVPIAAPSANLSGKPSPTAARHVIDDMCGRVDCIIDGGDCDVGVESTVVDMSGDTPIILRPGKITLSQLKKILPDAVIDKHVTEAVSVTEVPRCPGMKYKHYAPDAVLTVVEGTPDKVRSEIAERLSQAHADGKRTGVIVMSDINNNSANKLYQYADYTVCVGKSSEEYAKNMFTALRSLDENKVDVAFAEFSSQDDLALTVKNRLYKSAANRVIYV